jgi:hypothetical protein
MHVWISFTLHFTIISYVDKTQKKPFHQTPFCYEIWKLSFVYIMKFVICDEQTW